jgi:hypothetical protein
MKGIRKRLEELEGRLGGRSGQRELAIATLAVNGSRSALEELLRMRREGRMSSRLDEMVLAMLPTETTEVVQ